MKIQTAGDLLSTDERSELAGQTTHFENEILGYFETDVETYWIIRAYHHLGIDWSGWIVLINNGIPFTTELVPGGGYSLLWPLQGGSNVYERVGKSVIYFGAVKGRKRANLLASRCILWLCKSRRSILLLWFIHVLETVHLQPLKGMKSSKLGMWKGYHLSIKGMRNGYLSCKKWYLKG